MKIFKAILPSAPDKYSKESTCMEELKENFVTQTVGKHIERFSENVKL
jgi:hypothetical protein